MKKRYKIQHRDTLWDCVIEIDNEFAFPDFFDKSLKMYPIDAMKNMVEFWSGWEDRLETFKGDYEKTFLQQLGREIFHIQIAERLNLAAVIGNFKNNEGWCNMDGSYGIKIMMADPIRFDHWEFEVEEVL